MTFHCDTSVFSLPPRALWSREWTDYVLQINSSQIGLLKHLHLMWLLPNPNSRQPLYTTIGGSRATCLNFGRLDLNGTVKEDVWILSEHEHGSNQHATILGTLCIGQQWPTINDTWQIGPMCDNQKSCLVVVTVPWIHYNLICDMDTYNWESERQEQFQKLVDELNVSIGTLQQHQKLMVDNIGQLTIAVKECKSQCTYMVSQLADMKKYITELQQAPGDHGTKDMQSHQDKCACSRKIFQYSDNLANGDIVNVLDKNTGLFDDMAFEYYNIALRHVKVRGLKGCRNTRPRLVNMELVYTYNKCRSCLNRVQLDVPTLV